MPKCPIEWNPNGRKLELKTEKSRSICFCISMLLNLLESAGSAYNIITHLFIQEKQRYNVCTVVLHMCAILACTAVPLGAILLLCHKGFIEGYNQQLHFQYDLSQNDIVPEIHTAPYNRLVILGLYCMIGIIRWGIIAPFAILICSLYFHFDKKYIPY